SRGHPERRRAELDPVPSRGHEHPSVRRDDRIAHELDDATRSDGGEHVLVAEDPGHSSLPSIANRWPFTYAASGESRKATPLAISCGVASRPSAVPLRLAS